MPLYRIVGRQHLLQPFRATHFDDQYRERDLEDWIEANPQVLVDDEPLLIIGRQVNTPVGIIDLLALDADGAGLVIELKRAPDQRGAIAQALEYTAWFAGLDADEVRTIAEGYLAGRTAGATLTGTWRDTFGVDLNETELNTRQRIFLVTEGNDERIAAVTRYLRTSGLDITLLSYNYYRVDGGEEILDLERIVGDEPATPDDRSRTRRFPTEEEMRQSWSPAIRSAYDTFREKMVSAGLTLRMKATGVSFYKQAREGMVFLCFVNGSNGGFSVWLRSDSMTARFDFDSVAAEIRKTVPPGTLVKHTPTWFILTTSPQPSVTDVSLTADIILRLVAARLD